jgi:hypothetical protein
MSSNQTASPTAWKIAVGMIAAAFLAGLVFVGGAKAANQIDASVPRTASEANLSLIGEASDLLKSADVSSVGTAATTSRVRPRRFFMPFPVAKNQSVVFARYFSNNTYPEEFTDEVESSYWDYYDTGLCERNSYSKMTCFSYASADFDIVNYYDEVVGEDTFVCAWDTAVWYPFARRKTLKWTAFDSACFWRSEA